MFSFSLTPTVPARVVSLHLFQKEGCPRLPFTLTWLVLPEALAQPQGLSSICNGATGPAEGAVLSAAAQGFLQVPDFRTGPQGWPLTLNM